MALGLGNNLIRNGGSLNPDGLSLDLQFATDKTLTARKGPTPTFTRASTATFVGSDGLIQSAAINAARFDHDPVTFASKGLLIEESRTNSQPHSSDYTQTATSWSTTTGMNASVLNSTTAPDGTQGGVLVSENTTTGVHRMSSSSITATGQPYTLSIFVKAGSSPRRYVSFGFVFQNIRVIWDTQTSLFVGVTPGTTAPTSYSSQDFGNGWYRLIVTATPPAGMSIGIGVLLYNGAESYTGTGTSNVFFWGAQLESGSFPSSYIPTVAASVIRSVDVCSITGSDFSGFYNQSEGSFCTESRPNTVNGTTTVFGVSNGTSNERFLNRFAQNEQVTITSAGVESAFDALNPVAGTLYKVAAAAKLNDMAMSINGLSVLTDTSQPMPSVDRATIGSVSSTVASIRYYRKRLPNAKLQALTA